jgi:hypothetical protein
MIARGYDTANQGGALGGRIRASVKTDNFPDGQTRTECRAGLAGLAGRGDSCAMKTDRFPDAQTAAVLVSAD